MGENKDDEEGSPSLSLNRGPGGFGAPVAGEDSPRRERDLQADEVPRYQLVDEVPRGGAVQVLRSPGQMRSSRLRGRSGT